MNRALFLILVLTLPLAASAQNSPPVGNGMPVQTAKTGNYTIKPTDLRTIIPMNCSAPCTVTLPHSTSSFPKGYSVLIQDIGSAVVTITATGPSTIYGVPLTSGSVLMNQLGQFAEITADQSNNYLANGVVEAGGGGSHFALGVSGLNALGVSGTLALGVQ